MVTKVAVIHHIEHSSCHGICYRCVGLKRSANVGQSTNDPCGTSPALIAVALTTAAAMVLSLYPSLEGRLYDTRSTRADHAGGINCIKVATAGSGAMP